MAMIIFLMLKGLNALQAKAAKLAHLEKEKEQTAEPTVKTCPYCLMEIPVGAVRCGHCTSQLEPAGSTEPEADANTV